MPIKTFMIGQHRMSCEAARQLLPGAEVEWMGWETDLETGLRAVRRLRPEVLLVESDSPLEVMTRLLAERQDYLPCRVLTFNLQDNHLHVYSCEQRLILSAQDFVDALQGGASPSLPTNIESERIEALESE